MVSVSKACTVGDAEDTLAVVASRYRAKEMQLTLLFDTAWSLAVHVISCTITSGRLKGSDPLPGDTAYHSLWISVKQR